MIHLAIWNVSKLSVEENERIMNGIMHQLILRIPVLPEFFAAIELFYPKYITSFELIENKLPKVLQRPHIFKSPSYISDTKEENYSHYIGQGYGEDEALELATQMVANRWSVWMLRRLMREKSLPLKTQENEAPVRQIRVAVNFNLINQ